MDYGSYRKTLPEVELTVFPQRQLTLKRGDLPLKQLKMIMKLCGHSLRRIDAPHLESITGVRRIRGLESMNMGLDRHPER
jgi:hypothetical protein